MKTQLAAKFEKNLLDGYPALVRIDGRTDERTNGRTGLITIVPFRLKSGTNIRYLLIEAYAVGKVII